MKPSYIKLFSIIIICCFGIIVYSNTFFCPFVFDDFPSIITNSSIKNFANFQNIWNYWPSRFITYFSFTLNYYFHQLNVLGYHLFNLAVHLCCAVLVWWLMLLTFSIPAMNGKKITKHANFIAFFAGLVFVIHPVQTQGVTYVIQRAVSMATLFYLASLCLYVKSRLLGQQGANKIVSIRFYCFSLVMAVMAMFTKEMAVTLPLAICLFEFSFFKTKIGINWKYFIFFFLTILIIPLTMFLTNSINFVEMRRIIEPSVGISPWHYFLTQIRVMVTYIRLIFLPLSQNLDYDYPIVTTLLNLPVLASLFFLVSIFILAIRLFRNYRLISFGIFWFFLTLLPESSVLPIKDVIFEHRLYLPMVGYSIILASGLYYLFWKKRIKFIVLVLCFLSIFYSILTYQRNKVWKDGFSLWNDVVRKSPLKARPYLGRGIVYESRGDLNLSLTDYNRAIEIDPNLIKAYNNRGNVYQKKGDFDQAVLDYNRAIKIDSHYSDAYSNLGNVYVIKGKFNPAVLYFTKAIALKGPNIVITYNNRGVAYSVEGNPDQAILDYSKAIELNPNYAQAYCNRAKAYYFKKEYAKARNDVHRAESLGLTIDAAFLVELRKY